MNRILLFASVALSYSALIGVNTASAQAPVGSTSMTAEVLSLETQSRIMVIRRPDGTNQRVLLDDVVGGFGNIRSGDRVLVTVRDEPGMARVSSLIKSAPTLRVSSPGVLAAPRGIVPGGETDLDTAMPPLDFQESASVRALFSDQVANLALRANAVDLLWGQFRTSCNVRTSSKYDDAREWFGLWDGRVSADLSAGFCRDLYNEIVDAGASINAGMEGAEESADDVLYPGTMRDIKRRYAMDWDGWSMSRPTRLER